MSYRRPPRTKFYQYLTPFIIIFLILLMIYYGWSVLNKLFIGDSKNLNSASVSLNIDHGNVKAMVGSNEWQNAPDRISLYQGERVKTGPDSMASLTFFDKSVVRLNENTEIVFSLLKKNSNSHKIALELVRGDIWVKANKIVNPNSNFSISTDYINLNTDSSDFSLSAPANLYVLNGEVQVAVKYNDEVKKTLSVGIGQDFLLSDENLRKIDDVKNSDLVYAISEEFKKTKWYLWNQKKDGSIDAFEESSLDNKENTNDEIDTESDTNSEDNEDVNINQAVYISKPSKNIETNKNIIDMEGKYDTEKIKTIYINSEKAKLNTNGSWIMKGVELNKEGENKISIEVEDLNSNKKTLSPFIISYDSIAPEKAVITSHKANDEGIFEASSVEEIIKGSVSKDTAAVIVNDYRLTKYVPNSGKFEYYAKLEYGNLKLGDNEYEIITEDKAGNQSEKVVFHLHLSQKIIDEADSDKDKTDETSDNTNTEENTNAKDETSDNTNTEENTNAKDETSDNTNTEENTNADSSVKITNPNGGKDITSSDTEFEISGIVPNTTAKVSVNDYFLSLFKEGDTSFKYKANAGIGNLLIGEKNTYTVKAFDSNNNLLGTDSINIDIESGASMAPIINIPKNTDYYKTTLDTLVLGGSVGKWVTRIYINDKELKDYIPGSSKFKKTITLNNGENTFVVKAEKNGETVGTDSITIKLEQ